MPRKLYDPYSEENYKGGGVSKDSLMGKAAKTIGRAAVVPAQAAGEVISKTPVVIGAKIATKLGKRGITAVKGARRKQKEALSMSSQGITREEMSTMTPEERAINALQGDPVSDGIQPATTDPSATDTGRDEQTGGRTVSIGTEGQPGFGKITTTGARGARPSDTQQIAGYEVSGMSPEEAERFDAPVARPATRAERGLTPVGLNNSGQGYGARRRDEGPDLNRKIAPPRSPGDQIRYRREVRELEADRKAVTETARTEEVSARTDIAGERLADEQEQQAREREISQKDRQKLDSLQQEFANPETTEERRSLIERELSIIGGKPMTGKTEKSIEMTDKQRADTFRDIEKSDSYLKWRKGQKHTFSKDEPSTVTDYINAERPELKYLVSEERTDGAGEPPTLTSKEEMKNLKPGEKYIFNGTVYTRK